VSRAAEPTSISASIASIAAGGSGVGRLPDGRTLFVSRTAPGDEVDVRIVEEKPRWARGQLVNVRIAGPGRREAPCPHHERCGGCTLEHLDYETQCAAKARIVQDALQRIGGIEAPRPDLVPSPLEFRYRNRLSFTLLRQRSGDVVAGFHAHERPGRVVDVDERCLLPEPALADAWRGIRAAWGERAVHLPAGRKLRLTVRVNHAGAASLLIEGGRGRGRPDELLARVPALRAIWLRPSPADRPRAVAGRGLLEEDWDGDAVTLGGATFLQVNRSAARALEQHVLTLAGNVVGLTVVDAYCGVGLHARRLARRGANVIGIERDHEALTDARRHAAPGSDFRQGTVEHLLPSVLPAHLVILNPPRAGVAAAVCDALLAAPPQRILYVSCDPATLARDIARLATRFSLRSLRCFDLFPQTSHTETVAELACAGS
jgi:23S rRNA (uracil1939-C5)-methyltransferase